MRTTLAQKTYFLSKIILMSFRLDKTRKNTEKYGKKYCIKSKSIYKVSPVKISLKFLKLASQAEFFKRIEHIFLSDFYYYTITTTTTTAPYGCSGSGPTRPTDRPTDPLTNFGASKSVILNYVTLLLLLLLLLLLADLPLYWGSKIVKGPVGQSEQVKSRCRGEK